MAYGITPGSLGSHSEHLAEAIFTPFVGGGLTYGDVHLQYADSELGQHHAGQPLRYAANWGYNRAQMLVDLGLNAHPIGHMVVAHGTVQDFLAYDDDPIIKQLSPWSVKVIRLAALGHDVGENTHDEIEEKFGDVVGDPPTGTKTHAQTVLERLIATDILRGTMLRGLDDTLIEATIRLATHKDESPEHRYMDKSHTWTFYVDAFHAQMALNCMAPSERETERARNLEGMVMQILGNVLPRLEAEADNSTIIARALDEHDSVFAAS